MTTIENYKGVAFDIETYYTHSFKGRGGWDINCEVSFMGHKKTFREFTTDATFIDQISDMKSNDASWDDIQEKYADQYSDQRKEEIAEWCEEIAENK